jgi:hypothetical protein
VRVDSLDYILLDVGMDNGTATTARLAVEEAASGNRCSNFEFAAVGVRVHASPSDRLQDVDHSSSMEKGLVTLNKT